MHTTFAISERCPSTILAFSALHTAHRSLDTVTNQTRRDIFVLCQRTPGEYVLPPPVSINVIPILGFADASKKPSFAPMHRQVCHVSKRVRGLDFRQIERYPLRERTRQLCIDVRNIRTSNRQLLLHQTGKMNGMLQFYRRPRGLMDARHTPQ